MALATTDEVARGWRVLTEDEEANAALLISAAEAWIRDPERRPDITDNDPIGKVVVIEVVRAAIGTAERAGHSSYAETMGPFATSGTLVTAAGTLRFLEQHAQILGITTSSGPRGAFGDPCGYRYPPPGAVLP